jgi:hypothetical protein
MQQTATTTLMTTMLMVIATPAPEELVDWAHPPPLQVSPLPQQ